MSEHICPYCKLPGFELDSGTIAFDCGAFSRDGKWSNPEGECYTIRLEMRVARMRNRIKQLENALKVSRNAQRPKRYSCTMEPGPKFILKSEEVEVNLGKIEYWVNFSGPTG